MQMQCECGAITGERCLWKGPRSKMVRVRYIPEDKRGTVLAIFGVPAVAYFAESVLVEKDNCARVVSTDLETGKPDEWVEVLNEARRR